MNHGDIGSGLHPDHREIRCRRLLFHCWHRGTQGIDLIFGSFVEPTADWLSAAQLDCRLCSIATTPICSIGSSVTARRPLRATMT